MSNFIYGNVICNQASEIIPSKIDFLVTQFCIDNNFGIHFLECLPSAKTNKISFCFQISDNFLVHYCELFLEPIMYTLDGVPILYNLSNDIKKLFNLMDLIFKFDFVEEIELRFSCGEVDECEYETIYLNLNKLKSIIMEKYLQTTLFPTLKVIINR